jgi:hypothetical protein
MTYDLELSGKPAKLCLLCDDQRWQASELRNLFREILYASSIPLMITTALFGLFEQSPISFNLVFKNAMPRVITYVSPHSLESGYEITSHLPENRNA